MAVRTEKTETGTDIVIDGFEKGIASSPHFGIANIQNANISTELGEVTASFVRENQVVQETISGGTLTFDSSGGNTTKLDAPADLYAGNWIDVTAATATIYATTADFSYLAVAGGGAGGGSNAGASTTASGGGGSAGEVATGTHTSGLGAYSITVGGGGTGGATDGGTGSDSVLGTVVTAAGGGGGGAGATTGASAGNGGTNAYGGGGGAPKSSGTAGTGATGTVAHQGGSGQVESSMPAGGGGGGASANGANAADVGGGNANGGKGGDGTASSITGSSVTYGGGGGGAGLTPGSGGAGGGGAGALGGVGTAGTANTGGGGGGSSRNGGGDTNHNGADGGSGIVVIRYLSTDMTATGGTITTDGSYKVHTFTTSGTFTVTSVTREIALPTGSYYVSYKDSTPQVKISEHYDPFCDNAITFVSSGTLTFNLTKVFGNPISKATERYADDTQNQYRYYILDDAGYVWVRDTAVYDDSLANAGIGINWILPDPTTYSNPANSIAVLNGWLMWLNTIQIYGKPTCNLGEQFELLDNAYMNNKFPTHKNNAYVGTTSFMYWCDGNYIGGMHPDITLVTGATASVNLQSYCSYSASSTIGTVSAILSGAFPYLTDSTGAEVRVPAVFFTDEYGTQPTNLTVETIYYIGQATPATGTFSVYAAATGGSAINIETGAAGNQYFNTFYPVGSDAGIFGTNATVAFIPQMLALPVFETAQVITQVGSQILIGCKGNIVYPWNGVDQGPSSIISLPESNVQYMLTVNQVAYMFAGNQGNIYITDGSLASLVLNLSDYLAGVPGSPGTYIESTYTWSDSMYLRGRVYFSVKDQTSTKTGNCGGVWSFVPTQNLASDQETGLALRLESQNSYGTYNGAAALLIPNAVQNAQQPLYWSAWYSSVSAPTYGIDYSTGGSSASSPFVIETDAIPYGTMLGKKTSQQLEYKLGSPLDSGATITAKYRTNLTDTWTACNPFVTETNRLSGYAPANFQQVQWLQFQFTCTPITSSATTNTFIRLREIRLR